MVSFRGLQSKSHGKPTFVRKRCTVTVADCNEKMRGVLEMLEVPEATRCVLLFMLEAVEGGLCLLEVLDVMRRMLLLKVVEMPKVIDAVRRHTRGEAINEPRSLRGT
jgi:hypothetical protein